MNPVTYIKEIKDFPKKGVRFQDITPLLENKKAFNEVVMSIVEFAKSKELYIDKVVGIESRGFVLAAPVAFLLDAGLVMMRKKGKLPREIYREFHELEYGKAALDMHKDSIKKGEKVLIIDDLLATGGTISAAIKLVEKAEGIIIGLAFLIELEEFKASINIEKYTIFSRFTF